jgi:hypothetical protein
MNDLTSSTVWNTSECIAFVEASSSYSKIIVKNFKIVKKSYMGKVDLELLRIKKEMNNILKNNTYSFSNNWYEYNKCVYNELIKQIYFGKNKEFVKKNVTLKKKYNYNNKLNVVYYIHITPALQAYLKLNPAGHLTETHWKYIDHIFSITDDMKQRKIKEVDDLYNLVTKRIKD